MQHNIQKNVPSNVLDFSVINSEKSNDRLRMLVRANERGAEHCGSGISSIVITGGHAHTPTTPVCGQRSLTTGQVAGSDAL